MSWSSESGNRIVTEVIVGIVTAIIAIALLTPIPLEWKSLAIIVLALEGALILLIQVGKGRQVIWKLKELSRGRRIRRHPDLIVELYRLEKKVYGALYERTSSHPSLRLQGADAMVALQPPGNMSPLLTEFQEKVDIMGGLFDPLHRQIEERSRGHRWKTTDFVDTLREISNHLDHLNSVFSTVYRQAGSYDRREDIPPQAWSLWETLREEYNNVLHEWKAFTERFNQTIGYGTSPSRAEPVRSLRP